MRQASSRVQALRRSALSRDIPNYRSDEGQLLWYRGWENSTGSILERRAAAKACLLQNSTPVIDEGELLVGKPNYASLSAADLQTLRQLEAVHAPMQPGGQASHMAIDYEKLLALGIAGIQAEILGYCRELQEGEHEKREFYTACLTALDGVLAYACRYADHALALSKSCTDPRRSAELKEISATLQAVPKQPAKSFREALQSIHFVTVCLEGLYQLGRPDRYLLELYRADIQRGVLTPDTALELIDCLCILYNEYIPKGLAVGFMVGGRDAAGQDVSNELTTLFLESIGHTRMIYPGVGLCYHPGTPQALLDLSCELLSQGLSHPAIFNDQVITQGLMEYGLKREEACRYIHSTCVEITPIACSGAWVASPYLNLPQLMLDMLGIPPLSAPDNAVEAFPFSSFDAFKADYRRRLRERIVADAADQNRLQRQRYAYGGDPLVSCFVKDCLKRGRDIDRGGARYNWIMPSFVGLSNLADAFLVISRLVYEEKKYTLTDFARILREDYAKDELLRQEILNTVPKYGNNDDTADSLLPEITGWILEEVTQLETARGDRFVPSLFCWIMHEEFGTNTAATPDGRHKGFPLGDGSGPAQGREAKGPTASILSSTKWNHAPFIGGIAVNLKFDSALSGRNALGAMSALAKTYLERGGFEMQINVVDRATLLKAKKDPDQYRDLVVRVGGYSDYFVHLSPAMQEEVIARTGHSLGA